MSNPSPTSEMTELPSGVYWVGDPNAVIDNFFEQELDSVQGVYLTSQGKQLAIFQTTYGDGVYDDNEGDEYGIDTGRIGCIPIDLMDFESDLGHYILFKDAFECRWIEEGGFACFGDLSIKTDILGDDDLPAACDIPLQRHIKLSLGTELADLILSCQSELGTDSQLVMHEIAYFIENDELGDLANYADLESEERQVLFDMFHIVFHSKLPEFTDYFRGYYASPDNQIHVENMENGLTKTELYELLENLNWPQLLELCRRYSDLDTIAILFKLKTGLDYYSERSKNQVKEWDGAPCWEIVDGKYVGSE